MEIAAWAVNEKKYERAYNTIKASGAALTDEAVKAEYVKYGGLLQDEVEEVEEVIAPKKKKK